MVLKKMWEFIYNSVQLQLFATCPITLIWKLLYWDIIFYRAYVENNVAEVHNIDTKENLHILIHKGIGK